MANRGYLFPDEQPRPPFDHLEWSRRHPDGWHCECRHGVPLGWMLLFDPIDAREALVLSEDGQPLDFTELRLVAERADVIDRFERRRPTLEATLPDAFDFRPLDLFGVVLSEWTARFVVLDPCEIVEDEFAVVRDELDALFDALDAGAIAADAIPGWVSSPLAGRHPPVGSVDPESLIVGFSPHTKVDAIRLQLGLPRL